MTIVNKDTSTHSGLVVTESGDDLSVDLELIGGRTLRMSAGGDELGAWPIDECRIESDVEHPGSFRLQIDGDDVQFTPTDPVGFAAFVTQLARGEEDWRPVWEVREDAAPADVSADVSGSIAAPPAPEPSAGLPADDPVAFLFGSSTPPTPPPVAHAADPVVAAPGPEAGRDSEWEISEIDQFDVPEAGFEPSVTLDPEDAFELDDDPHPPPADAAVEVELPVVEGVSDIGGSAAVDDLEDLLDLDSYTATRDDHPSAERDLEPPTADIDAVWAKPDGEGSPETGAGDEEDLRERFAPSSRERLASALASAITGDGDDDEHHAADWDSEPYELGPNTVASEVLETQRTLRDHRLKSVLRGARLKKLAIAATGVATVAFFILMTPRAIDFVMTYEGGAELPPPLPVSATTVPPPTTVPVTASDPGEGPAPTTVPIPGGETIFDQPAAEFVARWDAAGGTIDSVLEFDSPPIAGPFEERFTPYLALTGVVQPDGRLNGFSLVIDPQGPAEYDRIGIQALGVAIATVEPERAPSGRAALLGELGFNVRQPRLEGVDGQVELNGVRYTLLYDPEDTILTMTVTPTG